MSGVDQEATTRVAWIGLGANLGDLEVALARLRHHLTFNDVRIERSSSEIMTAPVGVLEQPDFRNQVVVLEAPIDLPPEQWLALCKQAERAAGRKPTYKWGPRYADADILLLGEHGELRVDTPALRVPHAELINRPFFCRLLAEIDPELTHPDGWLFTDRMGAESPTR